MKTRSRGLAASLKPLPLALLCLSLSASAQTQETSKCGCSTEPPSILELAKLDDTHSIVLAYVAAAEGSSRVASALTGPGSKVEENPNAHPYPWLRYALVA